MSDMHPLLSLLMDNSSFIGAAEELENEIMPIDAQLNLGIGHPVMVISANTPLERDFIIGRVIDPAQHAETYPDWEDRLLNSYVLLEYFSKVDPELTQGWFARVKLLPISAEHYDEALDWIPNGFPDEPPDWSTEYYLHYTDQLADHAPDRIAHTVSCPYCSSKKVALQVSRRVIYGGRVGVMNRDGHDVYLPVEDMEEESNHHAKLVCLDCHAFAELEEEEWHLH